MPHPLQIPPALLALLLQSAPAQGAPLCPQADLVQLAGLGEGVVEATLGRLCQVRLADGRLVTAAPADLIPAAAGDTPPEVTLPLGLMRCHAAKGHHAPIGLALAPGLYILDDGQAGSLHQQGSSLHFDSGPLHGSPARIEGGALIFTPPGATAEATCQPYDPS